MLRMTTPSLLGLMYLASCGCGGEGVAGDVRARQVSWAAHAVEVALEVPSLEVSAQLAALKARFESSLRTAIGSLNGGTALAPFGASRVTALRELDLDGLVIIDCSVVGSPAAIEKSFAAGDQALTKALQQGLEGSMDTTVVQTVPLAAQILGRLALELDVQEATVTYWDAGAPDPPVTIEAWDAPSACRLNTPQRNAHALATHFAFTYAGKPREVVVVTSPIADDASQQQLALPQAALATLAPRGFSWLYISADGVLLFSKGIERWNFSFTQATRQLDAAFPDGKVILDYPENNVSEVYGHRLPLETWGFSLLWRYVVLPEAADTRPIFGYVGGGIRGDVRVYTRGSSRLSHSSRSPRMTLSGMRFVERATYRLMQAQNRSNALP